MCGATTRQDAHIAEYRLFRQVGSGMKRYDAELPLIGHSLPYLEWRADRGTDIATLIFGWESRIEKDSILKDVDLDVITHVFTIVLSYLK